MVDSGSHLTRGDTERIVEAILQDPRLLQGSLGRAKLIIAEKLRLARVPKNTELIGAFKAIGAPPDLVRGLRKKPVRTGSGITVITVAIPIFGCPHGRCIYCPGGGETGFPQSYTGEEPVVRFARSVGYDVEEQVKAQVKRLEAMGHDVDKVEVIFIGGTYTYADPAAQRGFIKAALDGLHGSRSGSVEEAVARAEKERPRLVGMMIETRPDCITPSIADELLGLGVTRVELGVQALDDEIYRLIARGHTVRDVVEATRILRDRAFKVGYHFMVGLPGSNPEKDLEMYETLFNDPRFRPDTVKIYPTMVVPGTPLHWLWKRGEYRAYPLEVMVDLLVGMLAITPPYVRIQRVRREIPEYLASDGRYPGNLREIVEREAKRRGIRCMCVRCREVGRKPTPSQRMGLRELRYETLGGVEVFLSYESLDGEALAGLLRLRLPERPANNLLLKSALVRELHVYGEMTPVGRQPYSWNWQHRGIGTLLLERAERIASEEGFKRVVIISGLGVKEYYYKRGYVRYGPYVAKEVA